MIAGAHQRQRNMFVWLVVCGGLMGPGCGRDSERVGAQLFSKATLAHAATLKEPHHASPEQIENAIQEFSGVIQRARGTVWAANAIETVGVLYLARGDSARAREVLTSLCREYDHYAGACMMSLVHIGRSYEAEQNWEEAERTYTDIDAHHPWTPVWMEAPLYTAQMHARRGDPVRATAAYQRAVAVYQERVRRTIDPERIAKLNAFMVTAYEALGQWDRAAATLEEMLAMSEGVDRPQTLMKLGTMYEQRLGHPERADAVFEKLIAEFPDHPLAKEVTLRRKQQ